MEYFFILGRNPELSRAEIFSYFECRGIDFKQILYKENFIVLSFEKDIKLDIQEFGGVLRLGKILFKGNLGNFKRFLEKEEVVPADKFKWSLFGNFPDVEDWLIDKFKKERKKAMIRRGSKGIKNQGGEFLPLGNAEFQLFCFFQTEILFGLVEQDYDYADSKKRDMQKPVRREELAISPRLAKILINLSQVKPGQRLLDCFCGVGVILQEALIKGIDVIGVDVDKEAIAGAKENINWLTQNYKVYRDYQLYNKDSAQINVSFDGVATESSLGELVKSKQSNDDAQRILANFERQIIGVLRNLKQLKKNDTKIAITFPYIRDNCVDFERICRETGLEIYDLRDIKFPIKEFREDQFISREIFVFE